MRRAFVVALIAAAFVVYRRAVTAYFFDDDFQWLVGTWGFEPAKLVAFWRLTHFYRPVIESYFVVATPLFGGSPILFHSANIALHVANALVLFALAREVSGSDRFGFVTALMFVVQPADVDAIAWVSALAEPLGALFGCLSLLWFLYDCRQHRPVVRALSLVAFIAALLTHESSVVFLPLLALAYWAFVIPASGGGHADGSQHRAPGTWHPAPGTSLTSLLRSTLRVLVPYIVAILGYLIIDITVNSRNYVVTEGYYRLGLHAVGHIFDYIVALYVGKRNALNYVVVAAVLGVAWASGNRRAMFAASWLVLTLLPFAFFTWSNTSRYMYLPAMGFAMLVSEGSDLLDRFLARHMGSPARMLIIGLLVGAVAVRFTLFASQNVGRFADATERYRRYIVAFKQVYGTSLHAARVQTDAQLGRALPHPFVNALVQWEYRDPTIELVPYEQDKSEDIRH